MYPGDAFQCCHPHANSPETFSKPHVVGETPVKCIGPVFRFDLVFRIHRPACLTGKKIAREIVPVIRLILR
jgi:hypothetical protein